MSEPVPEQQFKQDCSHCRHIFKCRNRRTAHDKPLSDRNDTINLLVCRLKFGVNKNGSARTLLQLFRPGMVNLVSSARSRAGHLNIDFDVMLMDMQSFAIEAIMTKYRIGDLNPITNFLFDIKSGYLVKWAQWYVTKQQRFTSRHMLSGGSPFNEGYGDEEAEYDTQEQPAPVTFGSLADRDPTQSAADNILDAAMEAFQKQDEPSMVDDVMDIIEDGVTLNANEYRVFKFYLQNANENNSIRMIDGLHIHLSKIMNVSRPRVTRLYKRGRDKVINAVNSRRQANG